MTGEAITGEDIAPGDQIVVVNGVVFKRDPCAASLVTCECDDPSDHKIGDVKKFIVEKKLTEVWNLRGSHRHRLVFVMQ